MLRFSRNYLLQTTREVIGNINRGYGPELVHSVHQNIRLAILAKHSFYLQHVWNLTVQFCTPDYNGCSHTHSTTLVRYGCGTNTFRHDLHTRVLTITPTEYNTTRPHSDADTMEMRSHFITSFPHARSLARCALVCLPGLTERGSKDASRLRRQNAPDRVGGKLVSTKDFPGITTKKELHGRVNL